MEHEACNALTLTYVSGQKADKSLTGANRLVQEEGWILRLWTAEKLLGKGQHAAAVAVCLFVSLQSLFVLTFVSGGGISGRKRELCKYCSELQLPTLQRSGSWQHSLLFISSSSSACMSLRVTLLTCAWQVSCVLPPSCQEKAEELTASACSLSVRGVRSRPGCSSPHPWGCDCRVLRMHLADHRGMFSVAELAEGLPSTVWTWH